VPPWEFATAGRIVFGAGAAAGAADIVMQFGVRVLLVTGVTPPRAQWLADALAARHAICSVVYADGEPDVPFVRKASEFVRRKGVDVVVGVGGGSAMDAAKAIAALATNEGDPFDYLEVVGRGKAITRQPLPCVAIPTTAGTGSEVTRNAVLLVPDNRVKVSLRSPLMLPRVAIVDPELTYDLPPRLTAQTGLDALTQVIEPFLSLRATPLVDVLCREGVLRAARSLRTAFADGRHARAREDMSMASLYGGFALANAGLGAVHALAGPIGGMFSAPHGAVCAALLPQVLAVNRDAMRAREPQHPALARLDDVARLLTGTPTATADDGIRWLEALVADLEIPGLRTWGLSEADLGPAVDQAARSSSMKGNPIGLTPEELTRAVVAAL
jgi:alcohol dehydrogenase class IV